MDSLKHSHLRHFVLHIYTEHIDPTSGVKSDVPLGAAEQVALDLDVKTVLERFVAAIPTLQTAVLSIQAPRDRLWTRRAMLADGHIQFEEERKTLWNAPRPTGEYLDS